jgi:hypothetical protein
MRYTIVGLAALLALGATACGGAEDGTEPGVLGVASEAQLQPDYKDYTIYALTQNGSQIGQVLVATTADGTTYAANREYWYMTSNVSTSYSLTFTSGAGEYWSSPPSGLGTLSFTMDQRASWTGATPQGSKFKYMSQIGLPVVLIDWEMTQSGGTWSGSIYWYHNTTTNVFGPSETNTGTFSVSPSGTWYEYTANPL